MTTMSFRLDLKVNPLQSELDQLTKDYYKL